MRFLSYSARALVVATACVSASPTLGHSQTTNPDSVVIHTSDISRFWRAVDRAPANDTAALIRSLRNDYLSEPSPGLFGWIVRRLINESAVDSALRGTGWDLRRATRSIRPPAGTAERAQFDSLVMPVLLDNAARRLALNYLYYRPYYDAVRLNVLAVDTATAVRDSIHAALRRLSVIYPEARFGDVYFVIGILNSGGTVAANSLLIGTEMFGRDSTTPLASVSSWHRAVTGQARLLPSIVSHEMIHTLQGRPAGTPTLLWSALHEGGADFLAELISGHYTTTAAIEYGKAHERELWEEFERDMDSTNTSHWLYEGDSSPPGRPADLGYWIGYRISKAYYERAADKRAAVRDILELKDPKALLASSGYGHF